MSNFTRSILYSTSVLVVGLVAIFAIYNDVANAPDGANVAQISPAAGISNLGITYDAQDAGAQSLLDNISSDAQDVIEPVNDAMQKAIDEIDSTIDEMESGERADEEEGVLYDGSN
ncbi:MAG: hypothetical protein KAJ29_00725 [Alphaproteobacteria bacterium]|nr:hypothetical protein [Alphaproteobacteria bacterium]